MPGNQSVQHGFYWMRHGPWDEPSKKWRDHYIEDVFDDSPAEGVIYFSSNQFLHPFRRDYTNKFDVGPDGKPVKFYEGVDNAMCPSFFQDSELWLKTGLGEVGRYDRVPLPGEEDKRGIYKGHLYSYEKVPAQCMVICQFVSGVLKTLGVPARVRLGFVKSGNEPLYYHHNELEYYEGDEWKLVDPTTIPEAEVEGHGFKQIPESEIASLRKRDFIHVYEAVRLVDGDPAFADRLRGATGTSRGLALLNGAMLHELFALRNEPITNWKVEEILYDGIPLQKYDDQAKLYKRISGDLNDVLVEDPKPDDVDKISRGLANYRLRREFKARLDSFGIKYHPSL